jgi:uncharacterized membrane protein HdeD (DUF308 family)
VAKPAGGLLIYVNKPSRGCAKLAASAASAGSRTPNPREAPMTTASPQPQDLAHEMRDAIRRHWVLFLIQGLIMIVLGVMAIGEPMVASIAVAWFAGWLFLVSGFVGLASVFTAQRVPGYWWALIMALLSIIIGIRLLWKPLAGVLALTLAIAIYFGAQGITQIIVAIQQRSVLRSWGWVVFAGVVNIILAVIIFAGWPGTAEWTLGLLFGINLLMWGVSLVMTSLACRTVHHAPGAPSTAAA